VLASDIFNFDDSRKVFVELTFGCGNITGGDLLRALGLMGLSPTMMSLMSQDNVSQFSYCLSPFANREARSQLPPRQPPYDSDMSSIAFLPCSSRLCREGYPGTKSCPNKMCLFDRLWKCGGGPCARVGHLQLRRQPQGIR
jgi:hypothetical protein